MLLLRTFRPRGRLISSGNFFCSVPPLTHLQSSLESSTRLLLSNQHDSLISCFKERGVTDMDSLHPLEKNLYALGLLFNGDIKDALEVQTQAVKNFTGSLGTTSDSFLDIAGSINDLAVIHIANNDFLSAEKQLKRALLMVDRSYRVDIHLRSTLIANLSNVYRLTNNKESCIKYTDLLLPLLSTLHQYKKLDAVDLSSINPAENQESLDRFWKSMTEVKINEIDKQAVEDSNIPHTRDKYHCARHVFRSIREVQFFLFAGHCLGTCSVHEEGLVYINKAFAMISSAATDTLGQGQGQGQEDFSLKESFLLSTALMTLAELSHDSIIVRGKELSSTHIPIDDVSKLFNSPYFKEKFPIVADMNLSLTSSEVDLRNASIQVNKALSRNDASQVPCSILSVLDMTAFAGTGIVGVALLDIEHHCPPDPPSPAPAPAPAPALLRGYKGIREAHSSDESALSIIVINAGMCVFVHPF